MPNGTYGGVRGKETKVCQKNFRFPTYSIFRNVENQKISTQTFFDIKRLR